MPAHKIEFAPELIAEAKRLYETTTTQVGDIAAMLLSLIHISEPTRPY